MQAFVPKSWADQAHAAGRAPRAIVTGNNPRADEWQGLVASCAQVAATGGPFLGPVVLTVDFALARPVSVKTAHHVTKPDIDKLLRAILDALTGVLYLDDKQVVTLLARKQYAIYPAGPKVRITLEDAALPDPEQTELTLEAFV